MSRDSENRRSAQHGDANASAGHSIDFEAEHRPDVARRASLAGLRREEAKLQKKQDAGAARTTEPVHDAAARGVASPTTALPHADRIQASFGAHHDVSQIQAHVGGDAAGAMGATAFASGNHVVFDRSPDLHTAAHEAAHVVQQAQGVNLYGGVGEAGDHHERHADAVADRVVAGQSAANLLGAPTTSPSPGAGAVQRKAVQDPAAASTEDRQAQREHTNHASTEGLCAAVMFEAKELLVHGKAIEKLLTDAMDEAGSWRRFVATKKYLDDAVERVTRLTTDLQLINKAQAPQHDLKHALAVFSRAHVVFYGHVLRAQNAAQNINATMENKEARVVVVEPGPLDHAVNNLFKEVGWAGGRPDEAYATVDKNDWKILERPEDELLAQALDGCLAATRESAHMARMSVRGVDENVLVNDCSRAIGLAGELSDLLARASPKIVRAHKGKVGTAVNELHHLKDEVAGKPAAAQKLAGQIFIENLRRIAGVIGR